MTTISQRALLINYDACFGKALLKVHGWLWIYKLYVFLQFMDVVFFKGMLGFVRLAQLCSSNGSAVHYLCTDSATTVKIQATKCHKITSPTPYISNNLGVKTVSYVTVNMEALTSCSHTSGPSRKTPGQTGQAMGWALYKAIQKKRQSFVEKRLN